MRNNEQLPRGRQILGVTALPPPVREKELAPPPTKEEARAANAGEFAGETRVVKKVGGSKVLKAVLGGGAVIGAGAIAYETVPAFHQAVDSAFPDHIKGKSLSSEASIAETVFDNTATKGVIKPNMIGRVPQEEIDKLNPLAKIDDHNTVQVLYPIDVSASSNPNAEIKFKKSNTGNGNEQDSINRAEQGFYNAFKSSDNIPSGTIIYAPMDGQLIVYTWSGNPTPINDHDFITATIDFQVNGKDYRMIISGGKKNRGDVLKSLTNAPVVGSSQMSSHEVEAINKKAIEIKMGTPIFQVTDNKSDISFSIRGDFDQNKTRTISVNGKEITFVEITPTNLEFFLTPNGRLVGK